MTIYSDYMPKVTWNGLQNERRHYKFNELRRMFAHYPLNGNSTNYGSQGSATDTSITYTTGKIFQAASFNGTTSKIDLDDFNEGIYTYSFSVWIYGTVSGAAADIFSKYVSANERVAVTVGSGLVYFTNSNKTNNEDAVTGSVLSNNTWHHIICTYDGEYGRVYVDNVLQATSPSIINGLIPQQSHAYLGERGNSSRFYSGLIDDFRFYEGVLSSDERAFLYNSGSGTESAYGVVTDYGEDGINITKVSTAVQGAIDGQVLRECVYISSTSSVITIPGDNLMFDEDSDFSVTFWLKTSNPAAQFQIISSQNGDGNGGMVEDGFRFHVDISATTCSL